MQLLPPTQHPAWRPGNLIANLVALIGIALALAFALDQLVGLFGGRPFAVCWFGTAIEVMGRIPGMIMAFAGFVGWAFTSFRNQGLLLLGLGGLAVSAAPMILAAYMGVSCGP